MGFLLIGIVAGLCSGLFGIGGGIVVVPALIYGYHFAPHLAVGTSLTALIAPVGLAAVIAYYTADQVHLKGAGLIALGIFVGAWLGSGIALKLSSELLRVVFGLFLIAVGIYTVVSGRPTAKETTISADLPPLPRKE